MESKNGDIFHVSIHAPTQGATDAFDIIGKTVIVSIHAPTQGATILRWMMFGADSVSIHAPTQGATGGLLGIVYYKEFQSTHPRRVRQF